MRETTGYSQAEVSRRTEAKKPPGRKINLLLRLVPLLAMRLEGSWRLGSRRLHRRNRDLRALKSALQCGDAGSEFAVLAVFHRHPGVQRPGITIRVVARQQAEKLLAPRHGVLACRLCGRSALGRSRINRRVRLGIGGKRIRRGRSGITHCKD